jgi:AcrR family transcriptional regulator
MKPVDRREQDRLKTRAAILDATEQIMREDGYAAVTSRRVAERAGLKSQLVHYHFGTMDELFQEAYRRNAKRFFDMYVQAISAKEPLAMIFELSTSLKGMDLVSEYLSAANHRKILRDELVQSWSRFRTLYATIIQKYYDDNHIDPGEFTPVVMTFLISSIGSALMNERGLGFSEGHQEIIGFVRSLLKRLQENGESNPASPEIEQP